MKLSEFRQKLQANPEYVEAVEELQLQFELANSVLKARLKKGWSQTDLANAVGTKQANISRIESGLANPTITLVQKLIKKLDLEIKITSPDHKPFSKSISGNPEYIPALNAYRVQDWPNSTCNTRYENKSDASIEEGKFE
jgi:ribosome-binding protein aMBF1 (putative translation factor)